MPRSEEPVAFERQVLDTYLSGLQAELETKLRDLRGMRQALGATSEWREGVGHIATVRALVGQFDRMLATNRGVRETLLHLRETAHSLMQRLNASRS